MMADSFPRTEYTPSTLFELADAGFTEPASAILSDPALRKEYEARSRHGLPVELALGWGIAAFSTGNRLDARRHWKDAGRLAPSDRAISRLAGSDFDDASIPGPSAEARAAAREEMARIRHNSAFPHRLIRFASVLSAEPEDVTTAALQSAEALLEQDIREAPRSYTMVLPVVRGHYPAIYGLHRAFFEATAAILSRRDTPKESAVSSDSAKKREAAKRPNQGEVVQPPSMPHVLPPLRIAERRWVWPSLRLPRIALKLPNTGYAWVGALLGALFFVRNGFVAVCVAGVVGFLLAYAVYTMTNRR